MGIPLLSKRLIFPFEPYQFILLSAHRPACAALRFQQSLFGPAAVRTLPEIPRHLCHLPARFPREPNRLRFEGIGALTSSGVWHTDLRSYDSPT
jgi:hypothetical protein